MRERTMEMDSVESSICEILGSMFITSEEETDFVYETMKRRIEEIWNEKFEWDDLNVSVFDEYFLEEVYSLTRHLNKREIINIFKNIKFEDFERYGYENPSEFDEKLKKDLLKRIEKDFLDIYEIGEYWLEAENELPYQALVRNNK